MEMPKSEPRNAQRSLPFMINGAPSSGPSSMPEASVVSSPDGRSLIANDQSVEVRVDRTGAAWAEARAGSIIHAIRPAHPERTHTDLPPRPTGTPDRTDTTEPTESAVASDQAVPLTEATVEPVQRGRVDHEFMGPAWGKGREQGKDVERRQAASGAATPGAERLATSPPQAMPAPAKPAAVQQAAPPAWDPPADHGALAPPRSVRLEVQQPELGRVQLHVQLVERTVHASVTTEYDELRQFLVSHQGRLDTELKAHGFEMGSFQVHMDQREHGQPGSGWLFRPDQDPSELHQEHRERGEEAAHLSAREPVSSGPAHLIGADGAGILSLFA